MRGAIYPYIGGKWRLAPEIIKLMPKHDIYCEPFFGSGGVYFQKQPARTEVINDLNSDIVNFFRVLRDREKRIRLIEMLTLTPYSREEFNACRQSNPEDDDLTKAYKFYIATRMGHGGFRPNMTAFLQGVVTTQGWRYSKGESGTHSKEIKQFRRAVENLEAAAERMAMTFIEHEDYKKVVERWDEPETVFYFDPPYDALNYYRFNFSEEDHRDLHRIASGMQGKCIISYYGTELIEELYRDFHIVRKEVSVNSQSCQKGIAKSKREELLICNFEPVNEKQLELFGA